MGVENDRKTPVPQETSSNPGLVKSMEAVPDSGESVMDQIARKRQALKTRRRTGGLLLPAAVTAGVLALIGPEVRDAVRSGRQTELVSKIEHIEEKPNSRVLGRAQLAAEKEFFATEDGKYDKEAAERVAKEMAFKTKGVDWQLDAKYFINADDAEFSPDGRAVKIDGQYYSFGQYRDADETLYIIAGKTLDQSKMKGLAGLGSDRVHMVSPQVIGGQKLTADMTDEQQIEGAYANAKTHLEEALKFWENPPEILRAK